ncbi:MAG: hypothetical protein A3A97_04935 [Candidatus Terrybacteria bacterium RIFCSPLOWO2_01_FULL_40_23]|uniref:Reverse transcriptase domain-containing protein n=1 Tax=Candidatus Terrybacteria bacterium RIFCSPLOWO2_01_FULL_40_23 TaxID=1802366 RepID=A0A1G2PX79_9BACT|nr:MAG: hypothetical protein A3A97_04935 [Candidatus Terrybacteria bacterium RIFCSPLOWO2_01_FULL_40_23]
MRLGHVYHDIISVENLLSAWREFLCGKRKRKDVGLFSVQLMDNILALHRDLVDKSYRHDLYHAFKINDSKPRDIHKASVRDRLLHHAIYRIIYPYFDRKFIFDSYSCRDQKGTHRAINRFRKYALKVSHNNTSTIWILKCDIRKFFVSINHSILKEILKRYTVDVDAVWLLEQVIDSFHTKNRQGVGLPLGNLTSQLLMNIYMNEFDQFVKRKLKLCYYIRYADDFIIFHKNKQYLIDLIPKIEVFLENQLKLSLHPDKVSIKTFASSVDFLGWVHFPHHRVLRTSTKRRMVKKIKNNPSSAAINSYSGLLNHGNAYKLRLLIKNE